MNCQRCGHCCVTMPVCILVPNTKRFAFKPGGAVCPHLSFNENKLASCAVHKDPQYQESPCHVYGNSDYDSDFAHKRGKPCPVGTYLLNAKSDVCKGAEQVKLEDLEQLTEP